jgi:hypothetical protein
MYFEKLKPDHDDEIKIDEETQDPIVNYFTLKPTVIEEDERLELATKKLKALEAETPAALSKKPSHQLVKEATQELKIVKNEAKKKIGNAFDKLKKAEEAAKAEAAAEAEPTAAAEEEDETEMVVEEEDFEFINFDI